METAKEKLIDILILEDEAEIGELIERVLQDNYNCRCDIMPNGQEGAILAMEYSYDLIITDLNMPELGGKKFIESVRDNPGPNKDCHFLIVTAYIKPDTFTEEELKRISILPKPFTPKDIFVYTERLLPSL